MFHLNDSDKVIDNTPVDNPSKTLIYMTIN